jgi:hypothetical protein
MRFGGQLTWWTSLSGGVIVVSPAIGFPGMGWLDDSSLFEVDFQWRLVTSEFVESPELHDRLELFSPVWSWLITCVWRTD